MKVNVNDLRLSNIVQSSFGIHRVVSPIMFYEIEIGNKDYFGIPLTEEILLKCGFEKIESDYRIQIQKDDKGGNTDYWICVDSGFDNETNKFVVQIVCQEGCWFTSKNEYVHQLQNLYFALTGEELTLKP